MDRLDDLACGPTRCSGQHRGIPPRTRGTLSAVNHPAIANFGALSSYWSKVRPKALALAGDGVRLDWADAESRCNALAAALRGLGVRPGDRVGLLLTNCVEWPLLLMAILRLGALIVTLNPRLGARELQQIEHDAECLLMIWKPELCLALKSVFSAGNLADDTLMISPRGTGAPTPYARASAACPYVEPALVTPQSYFGICYTSGTTGLPKGVTLTHGSVQAQMLSLIFALRLTSEDRGLVIAPLAYAGPLLLNLCPHLMLGGATFIERQSDPEYLLQLIDRERLTTIGCTPVLWQRMADSALFERVDISCLRVAFTGGAPVPAGLSHRFAHRGVCIRQAYGLSEFNGFVTLPSDEMAVQRPEVAGVPVLGAMLRIVDAGGLDCGIDEVGEIWIRGPQLMDGYWRNEAANAAAMQDGWFKTGDLGKRDPQGQLIVLERKKNLIISGGVNIYPAEIERALATLPEIAEVAVFGVQDAEWGERAIAVVHPRVPLVASELRARAKQLLGPLKCPREFLISPAPLPRTNLEKISRQSLPQLYEQLTGRQISAIKASVAD